VHRIMHKSKGLVSDISNVSNMCKTNNMWILITKSNRGNKNIWGTSTCRMGKFVRYLSTKALSMSPFSFRWTCDLICTFTFWCKKMINHGNAKGNLARTPGFGSNITKSWFRLKWPLPHQFPSLSKYTTIDDRSPGLEMICGSLV